MRRLRLQLHRGLTWGGGGYKFVRGTPIDIPDELTYLRLLRAGYVSDPDQQFNFISPAALRRAPGGQEILIIRDMGMGDVLMASLAIRALALKYPKLRITYACDSRYVPLFRDCWFLERTVPIPDLVGRFDYVLDLRGYSERAPERHVKDRIEIFGQALGVEIQDFTYDYKISSPERSRAAQLLVGHPGPRIGVVIRGSSGLRSWPYEHVMELCRRGLARGWGVVLLDQERHEVALPGLINLTGRLEWPDALRMLTAVIDQCDALVSSDTGPMHLAEVVGVPCVAIFSTIDPAVRLKHYRHVQAIWRGWEEGGPGQKGLPCCPCWERGCADLPCVAGIAPEMVEERVLQIVEQPAKSIREERWAASSLVAS